MSLTRRALLASAAFVISASAVSARTYSGGIPWQPARSNPPPRFDPAAQFFSDDERAFVTAAVDRLIPADDFPSASQAGVVVFLESQLLGAYGRGDIYYLQGPFQRGEATQGYQEEAPAILYKQAIADIEAWLAKSRNKHFAELSEAEQTDVLTELSEGKIELDHADAKTFFDTFWEDTQLGFFGDPLYGGNRDMASWRMIGFPGARYDYRPYVNHDGRELSLEPVSLIGGFSQEGRR